jgi:DNA-binding GntR family transcriptional regulator
MAESKPIIRSKFLKPAAPNVDRVADLLRDAIVSGRIPPGERIKEVPLAEELGLSRGPIREAIRLLQHDGLVKVTPNKGAVVPLVTSADLLEVYAMRASLGSLALHKLMLTDPRTRRGKLDQALARFQRAVAAGDEREAADADLGYQTAVVENAGLPRVTKQFDQLTWQVMVFIATLQISYRSLLPGMLEEVEALHEAITAREAEHAERLWREKFERWVRDFITRLDDDFDRDLWIALTSGPTAPG